MSSSTGCSRARCLSPPPSTAPAAARGRRLLTLALDCPPSGTGGEGRPALQREPYRRGAPRCRISTHTPPLTLPTSHARGPPLTSPSPLPLPPYPRCFSLRPLQVNILSPGVTFGEMSFLDGTANTATPQPQRSHNTQTRHKPQTSSSRAYPAARPTAPLRSSAPGAPACATCVADSDDVSVTLHIMPYHLRLVHRSQITCSSPLWPLVGRGGEASGPRLLLAGVSAVSTPQAAPGN